MKHLMTYMQQAAPPRRLIGYARVSTADQKLDMQLDALSEVGCVKVFQDHGLSGASAARPGLDNMMTYLEGGDMLVVYKLDRLGRSSYHLADMLARLDKMDVQFCSLTEGINTSGFGGRLVYNIFAAVAEFHRDLIRENTINGLRAARERGSKIGRPAKMTNEQAHEAYQKLRNDGQTVSDVARMFDVSESALLRRMRTIDA
jgi:DNA invertase Pin-like site-specific DNA recombinase